MDPIKTNREPHSALRILKQTDLALIADLSDFINNEYVPSKSGKTFKLYNPYTEEITAEVSAAEAEDVDAAVLAAEKAQPGWDAVGAQSKFDMMMKFVALVNQPEHVKELSRLEAASMGMPTSFFPSTIASLSNAFKHCASLGLVKRGQTSLNTPNFINITLKQPFGVVAGILPWNVPLSMFAFKVAPAIASGNAVVIKTSEKAPLTSIYLGNLIKEAGFPRGLINIVSGLGPEAGNALALHMGVRKISFTGSARTGRLISKAAIDSNLKNVTLELGGKGPAIVFKDADLEKAARLCAFSIYRNSGQICAAQSRVYVHKSIADEFLDIYCRVYKELAVHGDQNDDKNAQGPVADKIQYDAVMKFIDEAKAANLTRKIGGGRSGEKGYFIEPTVFTDVPAEARINREEVFGPVSVVHTFESEDEVINMANDTEYGLSASFYTLNINTALRVAPKIQAGGVAVNTHNQAAFDTPFGGVKGSGIGRELGPNALEYYLEEKSVFFNLA